MTRTAVEDARARAPDNAIRENPGRHFARPVGMHPFAPADDRPKLPENQDPDRNSGASVTASTTCPG